MKKLLILLLVIFITVCTACSDGNKAAYESLEVTAKYSIKELDEFFLNDGEYGGNSSYNCKIRSYDEVDDKVPCRKC